MCIYIYIYKVVYVCMVVLVDCCCYCLLFACFWHVLREMLRGPPTIILATFASRCKCCNYVSSPIRLRTHPASPDIL